MYFQEVADQPQHLPKEIYLLGHEGPFCLEARLGSYLENSLVDDLGGRCPTWGYSGAPLFYKDTIIVQTGAKNGCWWHLMRGRKFGVVEEQAGYASPYIRDSNPMEVVVLIKMAYRFDLANGQRKSTYQHRTRYDVNAAQPLDLGSQMLVASGYGKGAALLDLTESQPKVLWSRMKWPVKWQV